MVRWTRALEYAPASDLACMHVPACSSWIPCLWKHFKTPLSAHRVRKGLVAHARAAIIVVHDAGANRATPPHTPRAVKGAQCGQRASQAARGER